MQKFSKEAKLVRTDAEIREMLQALKIRFTWMSISLGNENVYDIANEFSKIISRDAVSLKINISSMNSGGN